MALRPSNTHGNVLSQALQGSQMLATRREDPYPNVRTRHRKYKSMARERRKEAIRQKMAGASDRGGAEEPPPFWIPARYKLLGRVMEDNLNSTRIGRKPIPENVKKEFAAHAKEYAAYK